MNYDNRVDSGIGLEDLGDKMPPGLSLNEGKKLRVEESQISRGLGLVLDYLNSGSGEHNLYELKRRAGNWCQAYFRTRNFACGLPEKVLSVHPHLFDITKRSYERLDSSPPELVHDCDDGDDEDDDDDGLSTDSFSLPPSINDAGSEDEDRESFPSYAEPVLLSDATLYGIMERYDRDHKPAEEARLERVMQQMCDEAAVVMGERAPHGILPFEIRIRAADLLESPIIYFIPEVLAHVAHLALPSAYRYKNFIDDTAARVEAAAAAEASRAEAGQQLPIVVSPPPGLRSPIQLARRTSVKRRRSVSMGDDDSEEEERGRGREKKWSILTALLHR